MANNMVFKCSSVNSTCNKTELVSVFQQPLKH